uniref:Uncharacterized protein n=1 Tax=Salmonella sp. TaxID=599 RepID=A0A482ETX7_SALSP|nr:hypothetical protein NNIBIDOC_00187 [Salmonella sp.]
MRSLLAARCCWRKLGWVATADAGTGEISRSSTSARHQVTGISGVVNFKVMEMPRTMDPLAFADFIYNECTPENTRT